MENLLSIITFLPLVAAAVMALFLRGNDAASNRNARWLALITTTLTFLISLRLLTGFDPADTGFQFVEEGEWIMGLRYKLGVDGISVLFVLLTTFLMPITILSTWEMDNRVKEYMIAFLVLEGLMIGVFVALDLVLFYLFFEAGLIPMFLIIGIWGGKERIYASFKFFLYTFLGSVLMLVAMIAMYRDAGTTDIPTLMTHVFASDTISVAGFQIIGGVQTLLWLAFFASFAVKMPMWPVQYLAARRSRAGADGGVGHSGRSASEDGRLRLPALLVADVPGGLRPACAFGLLDVGHRHRLHFARCSRAKRHEEAHRLFVRRAHGLCHHGHLCRQPAGRRWCDLPDDQPRLHLGGALPLVWA